MSEPKVDDPSGSTANPAAESGTTSDVQRDHCRCGFEIVQHHQATITEYSRWKKIAAQQQQTFNTLFGNREWDRVNLTDTEALQEKLSLAIFSRFYWQSNEYEVETIKAMINLVQELSKGCDSIHIGYTFVSCYINFCPGIFSLIRIQDCNGDSIYIDPQNGVKYKGWDEFLRKNKCVNCQICYPKNGIYKRRENGEVLLEYGDTDAFREGARCYHQGDRDCDCYTWPQTMCQYFPLIVPGTMTYATNKRASYLTLKKIEEMLTPHMAHSMGLWFILISPLVGNILKNDSSALYSVFSVPNFKMNSRFFKSFYDHSFGVSSFFPVVEMLRIITAHRYGYLETSHTDNFVHIINFLGNFMVTDPFHIIQLIRNFDRDWSKLLDLCDFSSKPIRELIYFEDLDIVDVIWKQIEPVVEHEPNSIAGLNQFMLKTLSNIRRNERNFEKIANTFKTSLECKFEEIFVQFDQDRTKLIKALSDKAEGTFYKNKFASDITNCSYKMLKFILNSIESVGLRLSGVTKYMKDTFEYHFMKKVLQRHYNSQGTTDVVNVFQFFTNLFVMEFTTYCNILQTKEHAFGDRESNFFKFLTYEMNNKYFAERLSEYSMMYNKDVEENFFIAADAEYDDIKLYLECFREEFSPANMNSFCFEVVNELLSCVVDDRNIYIGDGVQVYKSEKKAVIVLNIFAKEGLKHQTTVKDEPQYLTLFFELYV